MIESKQKKLFPNPFYVCLLLSSTLFVLTTFCYLISPSISSRADEPRPAWAAFAAWLDRRGPAALGWEVVAMAASGVLAMATDRWFPEKASKDQGPLPE